MGDPVTMDAKEQAKITVLVVGAGPAGLINARTLVEDGLEVTMVCKEDGVGGEWRNTYPDLRTNNSWSAFIYSGLDMPTPKNMDGTSVPARTYLRYLEDLYEYFLKGRIRILYETEVFALNPRDVRGWRAELKSKEGDYGEDFDRVVLATGYLGRPRLPNILRDASLPVYHSSSLTSPKSLDRLLDSVSESSADPTVDGDDRTILVIGGGKSGMDIAALIANRGRKVVFAYKGPLKWFAPPDQGLMGLGRWDAMVGPKRKMDNWATWFFHCTWLGARMTRKFWAMVGGFWSSLYSDRLPPPTSDPFLTLPHFAGGMPLGPNDFNTLVKNGHIATLPHATLTDADTSSVSFSTVSGGRRIRCAAIVAATGYSGGTYDFIREKLRVQLGLERLPPRAGWEDRVTKMRSKWKTIESDEVKEVDQPLVYRGILPSGRLRERDLAISGGTRPFTAPATTYELESHWISSMFQDDPHLHLPFDEATILDECHTDNEFNLARFPGIDPYTLIPAGTYLSGFNAAYHGRRLLRDMKLDPWRQKSKLGWWNPRRWMGDWLDVVAKAEDYASVGDERRARWRPHP